MAGTKGRSGGKRAGAGRKKKVAVSVEMEPQPHGGALIRERAAAIPLEECDMLTMLQRVALGQVEATALQVRAAIAAVQYTHPKKGESSGKKEEQAEATKAASAGKFGRREAPKLAAAGGKRVD